jgi:hypothetical protein
LVLTMVLGFSLQGAACLAAEEAGFTLKDVAGDHLDVLLDGRVAARYMYAYDKSTKERLHDTYKPYLHVFDAEGAAPITKGPGGQFTHHRGIFPGWMKISFQGKSYDRWHMKGGEIVHREFTKQAAGPDEASFTSRTSWNDESGEPILDELRTMTFRRAAAPARLSIDFVTELTASHGDITLDGDPEHAGVQYRPANEVDSKQTVYLFPGESVNPHKDVDYPWVGETYTLADKQYSVVDLNHPDNPKNTRFSAYRNYGRFGAFPVAKIPSGQTLKLRYRFLIADGPMLSAEIIQRAWDNYAGVKTPSPVPPVVVRKAE